jgi:hypothetical protein
VPYVKRKARPTKGRASARGTTLLARPTTCRRSAAGRSSGARALQDGLMPLPLLTVGVPAEPTW